MNNLQINFAKLNGLIPCVIQDAKTQRVLMLGFMNEEAFQKTVTDKQVTFFSRTKQRLWTKGETSGNYLNVVEMMLDCDHDTLLIKANPIGPVCHTGAATCFDEVNEHWDLNSLQEIIKDRKANPKVGSYTTSLFESGINKVAQKVGEEAVELIIEAKDENEELFLGEASDLLFHYLVLLTAKGYSLHDVLKVLKERHHSK
ncbi:MAG TPA: bifunctional phosphoribosyl-AMP cyclohydrolase/phosphoribosyl-ATP diphosphatase HisIE [Chryseolinea sp.]|nr:bifunctional phosphoribosyl-AMP cyclohydrolase/phosphoribosyl-ATP diphosphatase HisIE [Chryseolinea sp.]HPH46366.1 bifunctional phosphoribosyl-AMP cyclohydrolase/phosphoribosyl-ATP diphosphatase HisIE [Chryseolinea sp.]HPM31937.1 bifunctional phosphoribosyl-AMP cyclohydrolase/phosphoribosyl-ATP diphosphatase HisIE [Chryseolinea sp.]